LAGQNQPGTKLAILTSREQNLGTGLVQTAAYRRHSTVVGNAGQEQGIFSKDLTAPAGCNGPCSHRVVVRCSECQASVNTDRQCRDRSVMALKYALTTALAQIPRPHGAI
jgi:hypothetical protein